MTTPGTMNSTLERLHEKWKDAEEAARESRAEAMNSYGAGFDRGFADGILEIIVDITGTNPAEEAPAASERLSDLQLAGAGGMK